MTSEEDIVKLFNLFVMYPVEVALLQIKLPAAYDLQLRGEVYPDEGRAVRVDIVLGIRGPETVETLAVMEMKNFGVIQDEMHSIMAAKVTSVQKARKTTSKSPNLFRRNQPKLLLRQGAAYALRFKTRHVALCDWAVTLYLEFPELDKALLNQKNGSSAGRYVLMHAQTDPSTFHYALLAFFKRAVDEWLLAQTALNKD
jgi:hypothetical protein